MGGGVAASAAVGVGLDGSGDSALRAFNCLREDFKLAFLSFFDDLRLPESTREPCSFRDEDFFDGLLGLSDGGARIVGGGGGWSSE